MIASMNMAMSPNKKPQKTLQPDVTEFSLQNNLTVPKKAGQAFFPCQM